MSQRGVYSESKMTWWLKREGTLPTSPKQVHWILSDLCNQDCNFCSYRVSGNPSNELFAAGAKTSAYGHDNPIRWVSTERALGLVDEFRAAGVLALQFTGGGEPTVHPDHEDIFAKALSVGLRCALVSNGFRWRDRIYELLPSFDWVRVSIDAGTDETYSSIRRVARGSMAKVLRNVERLCKLSLGDYPTQVGIGFTVTPDNWHEIPLCAKLARDHGAHNVRLSAMFGPDNEQPFEDIYSGIKEKIEEAKDYERDGFTVYDNFGSRFSDLRQHSPDYRTCAYQYYTTYVGGDLNVYRCCVLSYSRRGMIAEGSLKDQRFDDYWASKARRDDFAAFDARGCPRCMFNGKNREWLYVIGNTESDVTPRHMEWV